MGYIVRWNKVSGRFTCFNFYQSRQSAILFLNHLILDNGIMDARLIKRTN